MKNLPILVCLLFWLAVVRLSAQVAIVPPALDFGEIGTSLVGPKYWKQVTVRNTSVDTLLVRPTFPEPLTWQMGETDVSFTVLSGGAFAPGDSAYLTVQLWSYGWSEQAFFQLTDTIWLEVRPVWASVEAEVRIPVPVHAEITKADKPFVSAQKGGAGYFCRCYIPENAPPSSSIETLDMFVTNPVSPANTDTLWIDSIQVRELEENGIPKGRVQENIRTYDTVAPYDFLNGVYPPSSGKPLPVHVLPGMHAQVLAGVPRWKPGDKRSSVRVYVRNSRDGRVWMLEDTLQYYLGVINASPASILPSRDPITMSPGLDVTTQDGFGMNKCGLQDETPLWVDTVYIRGPRQDAIDFVKRTGSDSLPKLPARLECFDSEVGYNIEVHRARTTPGTTVDTIVAEYHYDDPVQGRVEGVSKRAITIIIEPRTSGSVEEAEEPAGALTVIPNPATDRIRFEWRSFSRKEAADVRLFDPLGRDVLGRRVAFELSGSVEIDVYSLPAGTYRVVVEGREGNVLAVRSVVVVR